MQPTNIDELRRGFAERINELIDAEPGPKKLETFSSSSQISMRQVSQWRNPRHINWPSAQNILTLAMAQDISPTWGLLGQGNPSLSAGSVNTLAPTVDPRKRELHELLDTLLIDPAFSSHIEKELRICASSLQNARIVQGLLPEKQQEKIKEELAIDVSAGDLGVSEGESRWIKAMFNSQCATCFTKVEANQRALYNKQRKTILCESCGKKAAMKARDVAGQQIFG